MRESLGFRCGRAITLGVLIVFTVLPLYTLVETSLTGTNGVVGTFTWLPSAASFRPYFDMWKTIDLVRYLLNSLVVAGFSTVVALAFGVIAAHAIVRYDFVGKRAMVYVILATQTFPGVLFLLPLFVIYVTIQRTVGITLTGSYLGLVITYLSFALPFSIWLLVGYLETVPAELGEAAMVDGCRELGAFFRITLRVAMPGVVAVAVFCFIGGWSEVLFASVLTNDATRTLPIGLEEFQNNYGVVQWNQLMAAALIVSLPVVAGFLLVQRFFVRGLSAGGVK